MEASRVQGGAARGAVIGIVAVVAVAVLLFLMGEDGPPAPVEAPDAKGAAVPPVPTAAMVDDARIANVETDEPGAWLTYGRTYEEQRFSPLTQINRENVADLGIAWYRDFGTLHPVEATPLVVDGVMYATTPWNITYALDAATGEEVWSYDPEVPGETAREACCGVISRGLAVYRGRVYVATLDGRLIALDAASGAEVWKVDTVIDHSRNYTITGAPRAAAGKVYIGNGGAEFGVRGYVTAYDAETGAQVWRFFTVPGDPSLPFEHPEMEMAAETWKGGEWWDIGGGGTVCNSIVYDPDFNNVYLGVGNGSRIAVDAGDPLARRRRQPVPRGHRGRGRGHRRHAVVLPDHPGRQLRLHGRAGHDARGSRGGRRDAQGADAGAQERVFLRDRPQRRQAAARASVRDGDVGHTRRPRDGPARREPGGGL